MLKDEVSREIEERVKVITNDCWFAWKEYLQNHDMSQFNKRVFELKKKHDNDEFLVGILYEYSKKVRVLHTRYLMRRDGRLGDKKV